MRQRLSLSIKNTFQEWYRDKIIGTVFFYLLFYAVFRYRNDSYVVSSWIEEVLIGILVGAVIALGIFLLNFFFFTPLDLAIVAKNKAEKENLVLKKKIPDVIYQDGEVVERGTHNIYDIFGRDDTRRDMVFRNCTIEGKGMVAITRANRENLQVNFHLTGGSMVMKRGPNIGVSVKEFYECSFEDVAFRDIMILGHGNQETISDGFTAFDNQELVRVITQEYLEEYVLEHVISNVRKLAKGQRAVSRSGPRLLEEIQDQLEELKEAKQE